MTPEYVYFFFDKYGEEVGDSVYAMDRERCVQLEASFPRLAHKRAVDWRRYLLVRDIEGQIERGAHPND